MSENKPKICLTIAGLDPSGGAGVIADVKTFSRFGCFAAAAITSLTFQNTQKVSGAAHQTAEVVRRQIEPILDDYEVSALKTGMLPTGEIISEIAAVIGANNLKNFVVDPVVRSTSGYDLIDDEALKSLIARLFPLAAVITPNIPEAERIAQMRIDGESDITRAAQKMQSLGARNVLIKGGHFAVINADGVKMSRDYLFTGKNLQIFEAEYIETRATHGTGCTLSAAIAANLALGKDLAESVSVAKNFVFEAIRTAPLIGKGSSPINI